MSQVLGAFGLLDFTMLRPVLAWRFETYEPFISLIFQFFSDRSERWLSETADTETVDTGAHLIYIYVFYLNVKINFRSELFLRKPLNSEWGLCNLEVKM
jgi:hypothetical protein